MMIKRLAASLCMLPLLLAAAWAGPPYETDDPQPTDTGHWEIYAFAGAEGLGTTFDGTGGFDLNYGPVEDLQLTATLPLKHVHVHDQGSQTGIGDIEAGIKYRFFHDEARGLAIAVFPRVILPTSGHRFGSGKVGALLPVWVQKDFGHWSLFGGGGYALNPGAGNRDYWQGGVALTRQVSERFSLGGEVTRQGADAIGGSAATGLGVGAIYKLKPPFSLLFSGGPIFEDAGGPARYRLYSALSIAF
jgi:Putative MetA-pathway of phenol degradation